MRLVVVGSGGHARSVLDAAVTAGWEIAAVVAPGRGAGEMLGYELRPDAAGVEADGFIIAIGDNAKRAAWYAEWLEGDLPPARAVVHPSAVLGGNVTVGAGSFVAAGVVVNVNARIGANAILNTGCTVDHDCVVGDDCLVGPGSSICGEAILGQGVLVGACASVVPATRVGAWSTIGAGAAVIADLPDHVVAVGVPARILRRTEA